MEVIVNGQQVELGNSFPAITRKSVDINDPSARFIDFTNKFQLPDTFNNREIFDSPAAIGSDNRSFDKLFDAEIRDVFKIFKGKGYLDSGAKDKFSLQVVDDSKELFKALDIRLSSISWDDCDTELNQTAINLLDALDIDNCWFWGKACYHASALKINTDQTTGDARCKYSRPAFYVQGLLNRAVVQAGYSLTSPLPDLAFSSCHTDFFFTSYQKTIAVTYNPSGTLAMDDLDTNDFEHADITATDTEIDIGTRKAKFRLRGSITSNAIVTLYIRATDSVDPTKVSESKIVLGVGTQIVDFTTSEFSSTNGNDVDIRFEGTGQVVFNDVLLYTLLSDKDEDLSTNPWLDYKIKAHDNLPDLTYLDLYRLICVVSNKYHVVDNYSRVLSFGTLAGLNKLNQVDWSDKFIQGSETLTSQFSGLYKKNWLKYDNDLTVKPDLGWSYFLTDNESMEAEGDYLMFKFSASNDVTFGATTCAHVPIYNDTTRIPDQEIKIRLFVASGSVLSFASISWTAIVSAYYDEWFSSLYRIRAIEAEFNLSKLDVLKWKSKQLVYIDYFKTVFIVLEISNFIPGQRTQIKLLGYGR